MVDYNQKFNSLPWEIKFFIDNDDTNNEIKRLEAKYGINLRDIIYMVVTGLVFVDNIEAYLIDNLSKNNIEALEIARDLKKYILEPIIDYLYEEPKSINYWDDPENSVNKIKNLFKNNFLSLFDYYYNNKIMELINEEIYFLFGYYEDLRYDLLKLLLINKETVVNKNIMIDDKIMPGSVGSWIKDLIKEVGIDSIDNLSVSKYLVYSANPKSISSLDKERVRRILIAYKNIKNFYEDLLVTPEDSEIQIIPYFSPVKEKKAITVGEINQKVTEEDSISFKQVEIKKLEKDFNEDLEKKAIEEELLNKKDSSNLENEKNKLEKILNKYNKNSLERKAIEEELKKINS